MWVAWLSIYKLACTILLLLLLLLTGNKWCTCCWCHKYCSWSSCAWPMAWSSSLSQLFWPIQHAAPHTESCCSWRHTFCCMYWYPLYCLSPLWLAGPGTVPSKGEFITGHGWVYILIKIPYAVSMVRITLIIVHAGCMWRSDSYLIRCCMYM